MPSPGSDVTPGRAVGNQEVAPGGEGKASLEQGLEHLGGEGSRGECRHGALGLGHVCCSETAGGHIGHVGGGGQGQPGLQDHVFGL